MPSKWNSFIESGATFLSFINQQKGRFGETVDLFKSGGQVLGVISGILEEVGKTHWAIAGLSLIGHLLTRRVQMSENQNECMQLLQYMVDLADHINNLRLLVRQEAEKLKNALVIIVKGSMLCAKQLDSKKLFRFLKSSLDSKNLSSLRAEINVLYPDLQLTAVIAILQQQAQRLPMRKPDYPADAVGIKERERHVKDLLQMDKKDKSFRAVIIYGFGGIGKTTLAKAVYSNLKLEGYDHTGVVMDSHKANIKEMQQQILQDAFPSYSGGRGIDLRNQEEGKERLKQAFQETNKPVFLFIDNVLRVEDLRELLPQDLEDFGMHVRLLLTTRNLSHETNMFDKELCHTYLVEQLPDSDAQTFLRNKTKNRVRSTDVEKISKICGGIPLVIDIVCGHLKNMGYSVEKISQILDNLQRGEQMECFDLSKRMVDSVFDKFECFARDAFLDICCFFDGSRRRHVESAVGPLALKILKDAALITTRLEPEYCATMERNEERVFVHDVIKARGQNIAGSTRIKDIKSFEAAVKEGRVKEIKGIELHCDKDHSSYVLTEAHLKSLSKSLRVFVLGRNISVSTISDEQFPELRYINVYPNIPFRRPFHLQELKSLAVYIGPLLKQGDHIYKIPQSLSHIIITKNLEPSKPMPVAPNSSLEELNLWSFSKRTLPEGLQSFKALKVLKLYDLDEMELPEVICELDWLTTLSLVRCRFKDLPLSFGDLTSLKLLALQDCDRLEELPSTMEKLKDLRYLNLKGCSSLKELPLTFGELRALRSLIIRKCARLQVVAGFKQLTGLRYLNIQDCPELRRGFSNTHEGLQIVR